MEELEEWSDDDITLRVGIANRPDELAALWRVRYGKYVEELKEIPPQMIMEPFRSRKEESDEHDATAIHLIQTLQIRGGEPRAIGSLRFMRCDKSYALGRPDVSFGGREFVFPSQHPRIPSRTVRPEETVEASRWISRTVTTSAGAVLQASMQLFSCGLEALRREGRQYWINALRTKKMRRIVKDWPFVEFGPPGPHLYHGAEVVVCFLDVPAKREDDYPWERRLHGVCATV